MEEVDDYVDPILRKRGEIGIDLTRKILRPPTSAERCREWVNQQNYLGIYRRFSCDLGCPPTLRMALRALGGRYYSLRRRYKRNTRSIFGENFCFFSTTWERTDADECCYRYWGFFWGWILQSTDTEGSGHWYPSHPLTDFGKYLDDESAYENCCTKSDSTRRSCSEYYSVRPACGLNFWFFPTQWGNFFQLLT